MVENKRCILIADDEPKMVRALRDFFKASGFCVLEASNASEEYYSQIGYDEMLKRYQSSINTFVGPTQILISSDTLQVKDYSRHNWTMFDPEHKKERHATVFPEDKKKAFALGEQMVSGAWE